MAKKARKKKYRFKRGAKLAISDDLEGIMIAGNERGLVSLAEFILGVANMGYARGDEMLHHEHLGFSWHREVLAGTLRIHIGRKRLTAPTLKKDGDGRDVTIQLSKNPWKHFKRRAS